MRVLIWTQHFWPENFRINDVVTSLHNKDIKVTILTGKPNYPDGKIFDGYKVTGILREEVAGVEVIRIPIIPRGNGSWIALLINYLSFILSGYIFAPFVLRQRQFDVIFVYATSPLLQALPAIFIAWWKRVPLVVWVQDLWPESLKTTGFIKNRLLLWIVEVIVRYIYACADSILVQSEGFRTNIERLISNKTKIAFYPNPAEDVKLSEPLGELAMQIAQDFSVVFAGNIGHVQSCETIVAAAALLQDDYPKIKFYLIGSGSRTTSIARDIKNQNLTNIVMTGRSPARDMPAIFAAASVLLLSLKDDPALSVTIPSKLQSYLSAEKPIIVSANGEVAQLVITANAGLSCVAEDAPALANAVGQLYLMPLEEKLRLGKNGRQYFKNHYDISVCIDELINHLQKISNRPNHKKLSK